MVAWYNKIFKVMEKNKIEVTVMEDKKVLNVYSEIGKLKTVLLHRPGKEIENLTPDLMDRLLFDDIPYLEVARQEHDAFAKILSDNGVEVLFLEDLAAEAIEDASVKERFVEEYINSSFAPNPQPKTSK